MRFLLKLFSTKTLMSEILQREFPNPLAQADASAWKQVFHKVPAMKDWLMKREINLLKSFALQDKSKDYILGQIAEIKIAQSFDVPSESLPVDLGKQPIPKTLSRAGFLGGWNNKDANA